MILLHGKNICGAKILYMHSNLRNTVSFFNIVIKKRTGCETGMHGRERVVLLGCSVRSILRVMSLGSACWLIESSEY